MKEFKYRPQYRLFIPGFIGLIASFYLLPSIGIGQIGFSFLTGLLGISSLTLTIISFARFSRQLGSGDVKITDHQIEIPGHWTKRTTLNFNQIKLIGPADTWDKVIKISDGNRTHYIHGQLMSHMDFQELKTIFNDKLNSLM